MPTETPLSVEQDFTATTSAARRRSWKIAGDLPASFRYAAQGLGYAFASQRNFRIHVVIGLVVFHAVQVVLQPVRKFPTYNWLIQLVLARSNLT